MMVGISSTEMVRRCGVTYRQLNHWAASGLVEPIVPATGSGSRRMWHPDQIPMITILGRVSRAMAAPMGDGRIGAPRHILEAVAACWDQGFLVLNETVTLRWRVNEFVETAA